MKQNCVDLEYKKYPAQMLEVAGDLRRAPAKFENPVGFDPYFGETILILAFFSLCILNLSTQQGRKESGRFAEK